MKQSWKKQASAAPCGCAFASKCLPCMHQGCAQEASAEAHTWAGGRTRSLGGPVRQRRPPRELRGPPHSRPPAGPMACHVTPGGAGQHHRLGAHAPSPGLDITGGTTGHAMRRGRSRGSIPAPSSFCLFRTGQHLIHQALARVVQAAQARQARQPLAGPDHVVAVHQQRGQLCAVQLLRATSPKP